MMKMCKHIRVRSPVSVGEIGVTTPTDIEKTNFIPLMFIQKSLYP